MKKLENGSIRLDLVRDGFDSDFKFSGSDAKCHSEKAFFVVTGLTESCNAAGF